MVFLRARYDEVEQAAKGAARTDDGMNGCWTPVALRSGFDARVDAHIAQHDPEYVVADIEAKRQIVDAIPTGDGGDYSVNLGVLRSCSDPCAGEALIEVAKLFAAPFADHPDYDTAWTVAT